MTDIRKKMATELSNSHKSFSTQYISDESEPEVAEESDPQVTLSHNVDTLDTDSDKENCNPMDSGSELDFDETTTGHDASTNPNGSDRNHKVCSWNDLQSSL